MATKKKTPRSKAKRSKVKMLRRGTRAIADIKVGKRHRQDLGDIAAFAETITAAGLFHPIVIHPDGKTLMAGERRLAAYKLLGETEIPVTISDTDDILQVEKIENTARKDFLPSEIVSLTDAMAERERKRAKERRTLGEVSRSD